MVNLFIRMLGKLGDALVDDACHLVDRAASATGSLHPGGLHAAGFMNPGGEQTRTNSESEGSVKESDPKTAPVANVMDDEGGRHIMDSEDDSGRGQGGALTAGEQSQAKPPPPPPPPAEDEKKSESPEVSEDGTVSEDGERKVASKSNSKTVNLLDELFNAPSAAVPSPNPTPFTSSSASAGEVPEVSSGSATGPSVAEKESAETGLYEPNEPIFVPYIEIWHRETMIYSSWNFKLHPDSSPTLKCLQGDQLVTFPLRSEGEVEAEEKKEERFFCPPVDGDILIRVRHFDKESKQKTSAFRLGFNSHFLDIDARWNYLGFCPVCFRFIFLL